MTSQATPRRSSVVDRGGIACDLPSRTETDPTLRGTKHRAAAEREITVVRGAARRTDVVIVPEVKGAPDDRDDAAARATSTTGLAPDVVPGRPPGVPRPVRGTEDAVTETQPEFDDAVLGRLDVVDVLTLPVHVLAQRWRASQ